MPEDADPKTPANNDVVRILAPYAPLVAAAIILAWLACLATMITYIGTEFEVRWTRLVFVFSSVEAVAFAVIGAMFGTHIQRQRVETAERTAKEAGEREAKAQERAHSAEQEAKTNGVAAGKGHALAAAVRAEARLAMAGVGATPEGARMFASPTRESLRLAEELK